MADHVTVRTENGIGYLTLDSAERRNALSLSVMETVAGALSEFGRDPAIQAVVIDAAGTAFSAGHDLGEMVGRDAEFYEELFAACTEMMQTIHRVPQPVIAKVQGVATAAGCQLVAACDLAVAADTAWFATPGVKIGLFCSTPMVPVTRAIGRKRSMEMLLTGEPISAATAQQWGLVNRVVPAAELDAAVAELLSQITRFSPDVIALGKDTFYRQIELDEDAAYSFTETVMAGNAADDEAQEGFQAFLDKRPPQWRHQRGGPSGSASGDV